MRKLLGITFALISIGNMAHAETKALQCYAYSTRMGGGFISGSDVCTELNSTNKQKLAEQRALTVCQGQNAWNSCEVACDVVKESDCEVWVGSAPNGVK